MPQLGFKRHLAQEILSGKKPFTLRALRRDGKNARAGQTLYMYTDLRNKNCKKFAEKPCRFAVTINLSWRSIVIPTIGSLTTPELMELFSRLDGFASYDEFCRFHQIMADMEVRAMRLVSWVTRDELSKLLAFTQS